MSHDSQSHYSYKDVTNCPAFLVFFDVTLLITNTVRNVLAFITSLYKVTVKARLLRSVIWVWKCCLASGYRCTPLYSYHRYFQFVYHFIVPQIILTFSPFILKSFPTFRFAKSWKYPSIWEQLLLHQNNLQILTGFTQCTNI